MLPLPQTLGNYRVIAKLGQGGMARAMLAMRQGRGGFRKLFVIKQLRPDLASEPAFMEMFLDEARLAALLSHPNVVQTHEICEQDGECFISMDYLEGQSLARVLRRVTRESVPLILHIHIIAEVLAGLHYAHELRDHSGAPLYVVHRDVSPGNVFVTYDGEIKLLDFGIAKAAGSSFQTKVGGLKGKLAYMAPEQAQAKKVDRRSDIFAVGVMLWEALAGRRLVERGEAEAVTLNNRVNGQWDPIGKIRPDAPPDLIAVCERAMAIEPKDRFDTANQFRDALLSCLEHWGVKPTREDVVDLVTSHFTVEREQLAAKIAEKIESGAQFAPDEPLIPRARSASGMPVFTYEPPPSPDEDDLSITTHRPKARVRAPSILVGLLIFAAMAGAGLAYMLTRGEKVSADDRTDGATGSAAAGGSAENDPTKTADANLEPVKTIELLVSVDPPTATIELDGTSLEGNPYREQVAADDKLHEVVISAAQHEPLTRKVRFDRDVRIELSLVKRDAGGLSRKEARRLAARERELAAERARLDAEAKRRADAEEAERKKAEARALAEARAKAAANAKPKAGDSLTGSGQKGARPIDEKNPYKK